MFQELKKESLLIFKIAELDDNHYLTLKWVDDPTPASDSFYAH